MRYNIVNKTFVKVSSNWKVSTKFQVWGDTKSIGEFFACMEEMYKFRMINGCKNVTLTFKGDSATIIYTEQNVRYKEFYMFVKKWNA